MQESMCYWTVAARRCEQTESFLNRCHDESVCTIILARNSKYREPGPISALLLIVLGSAATQNSAKVIILLLYEKISVTVLNGELEVLCRNEPS